LSADAGYCSEANLAALESRGIDAYIATGRARDAVGGKATPEIAIGCADPAALASTAHIATPQASSPDTVPQTPTPPTRVEAMREKIRAGGHDSPYRLRKQLPEPVFGQIKQARGFRQFLLRGIDNVAAEWGIVCTAHNLLKLAQGWTLSAARAAAPETAAMAA
jgi:hypothetical protein